MNTASQPKTISEAIAMVRRTNEAKRNVSYPNVKTKRFVLVWETKRFVS